MTAMCSLLFADLPPFVMCQGQPAAARSMNFEGLRRRGWSPERISGIKAMHKALYRDDLTLEQAKTAQIADLEEDARNRRRRGHDVVLSGQTSSQRGIVR
jgi:UDP-N-acetylglucosamine acyltransferase